MPPALKAMLQAFEARLPDRALPQQKGEMQAAAPVRQVTALLTQWVALPLEVPWPSTAILQASSFQGR